MKNIKSIFALLTLLGYTTLASAQQAAGFTAIPLNDLSAFKQPGKNWSTSSGVMADYTKPGAMTTIKGSGVLVNTPAGNDNASLATITELGDLELELDFMTAKNGGSGVYLQGRYGLQLTDSWTKQVTGFADCGSVAERWDETRTGENKGFDGVAPSMNVCKAPGLWQHLKLKFRAPRFNEKGEKTTNAKFEEVYLNGVLVQQQLQLGGPARYALFTDEKPVGPLVFTGNTGAAAFRNISYRSIKPLPVKLSSLRYNYYPSTTTDNVFPDLNKLKATAQDTLPGLTWDVGKGEGLFAINITGNMELPAQDNYMFSFMSQGMGRLYIDDQLVIERNTNRWNLNPVRKQVSLAAGTHKVKIDYVKNVSATKGALALSLEGLNTDRVDLNDRASELNREVSDPVMLEPQQWPYLLRSFLNFGNAKLTHTISVGDPRHLNYSYDIKRGALIQVWRGGFLDVSNMWVERGEPQLAIPRGSLLTLSDAPALAVLSDASGAWPDSVAFDDIDNKGYVLDQQRTPAFQYRLKQSTVTDKISVIEQGQSLLRELTVTNAPPNMYCRVAAASTIETISEGQYAVNDRSYYVRVDKRFKPVIRKTPAGHELIVPIPETGGNITYSLTW